MLGDRDQSERPSGLFLSPCILIFIVSDPILHPNSSQSGICAGEFGKSRFFQDGVFDSTLSDSQTSEIFSANVVKNNSMPDAVFKVLHR